MDNNSLLYYSASCRIYNLRHILFYLYNARVIEVNVTIHIYICIYI